MQRGLGRVAGFACKGGAGFKTFWPPAPVQQARAAIVFAVRRAAIRALFHPSGLTRQSSRPAYGGRLTLAVRLHHQKLGGFDMTETIIEAIGHNGQLELTDSVVRIKRKGALAFLTQGLKGDKEILISQVSSIQFKKANAFVNGYMQLAFVGGQEAKGGILQGTQDENTVMFRVSQQEAFERLRDELQKRIAASKGAVSQTSSLDELDKLASLRDRGILTEDEFQQKKKQILGL